jgi:hypothetical protein
MADWIKVRSGILEPKHRKAIGACWQLYLYMLDKADWETGIITGWTDKTAADDLEMSLVTLRYQRRHLENECYIKTIQTGNSQQITIEKYENPSEKSAQKKDKGSQDINTPVKKLTPRGVNKLTGGGILKVNTPTLCSHLNINTYIYTNEKISKEEKLFLDEIVSLFGVEDFDTKPQWLEVLKMRSIYGEEKVRNIFKYYALSGSKIGRAVANASNRIKIWNTKTDDKLPVYKPPTSEELKQAKADYALGLEMLKKEQNDGIQSSNAAAN